MGWLLFRSCDIDKSRLPVSAANNKVLQDSLIFIRNKLNQQTAQIGVLRGDITDLRSGIASDKETIKRLQIQAGKQRGGLVSATAVNITTIDTAKGRTTIIKRDTVKDYIYPTYQAMLSKPWATYDMTMNADSAWLTSQTDNKIDLVQRYKRAGFLKKNQLVIEATNLNPDTGVTEMSSFHIKEKKRHIVAKVIIGILAGLIIGLKL